MKPMRILVDGHNLIPYLPGLSLRAIDDEQALIDQLQIYARQSRHTIEVFFDGAPPGRAGVRLFGMITAHFVSARTIADNAIRSRLLALGAQARQTLVVSSDRQVQAEARSQGARSQASDQFARELLAAGSEQTKPPRSKKVQEPKKSKIEPLLPPDQVQDWLDIFKSGKK
jgi:uncharacterized protein